MEGWRPVMAESLPGILPGREGGRTSADSKRRTPRHQPAGLCTVPLHQRKASLFENAAGVWSGPLAPSEPRIRTSGLQQK
ncbi:hypothetical protein EYF80_037992 [Liparis tanakae]|uniref:Uncharacterized protein n=1 Tax=Liparis tanakae TaxID=230148 RepID=A0A4Z2GGG0_9TELE|nr:hypothetical protein EYF80_037992 [Liparis tanakae]